MAEETNPSICIRTECWYEGTPKPRSKAAGCFGAAVGLVGGIVALAAAWIALAVVDGLLSLGLLGGESGWGIMQYLLLALSLLILPLGILMGLYHSSSDCPVCGADMVPLDSDSGRQAQRARDNFRNLRGL